MGRGRHREKPVTLLPSTLNGSRSLPRSLPAGLVNKMRGLLLVQAPHERTRLRIRYWLAIVLLVVGLVPSRAQSRLELVQTLLMPEVPPGPYADHMAVDLAGHRLFATPQANKAVDVFDLQTGKLLHTIAGFGNPHAIFYQSDLNQIYVTDGGSWRTKDLQRRGLSTDQHNSPRSRCGRNCA